MKPRVKHFLVFLDIFSVYFLKFCRNSSCVFFAGDFTIFEHVVLIIYDAEKGSYFYLKTPGITRFVCAKLLWRVLWPGFVHFIHREVLDTFPQLIEQCHRRLITILSQWKTVAHTLHKVCVPIAAIASVGADVTNRAGVQPWPKPKPVVTDFGL